MGNKPNNTPKQFVSHSGSSVSASGSTVSGVPAALPADLLRLVALFFDSLLDLLHFSVVCKRNSEAVLVPLKDKQNQTSLRLLKLHTRRLIGVKAGRFGVYCGLITVGDYFPSGVPHGRTICYKYRQEVGKWFLSRLQNIIIPTIERYDGFIVDPQLQQEALGIIGQHCLVTSDRNWYLGKLDGKFKTYNAEGLREADFIEGIQHGEEIYYDIKGYITQRIEFKLGMKNGWHSFYHKNTLVSRVQYKDDIKHGDNEEFKMVKNCEHPVLSQRCHYINGQRRGLCETWDVKTGILTSISHWKDDIYDLEGEGNDDVNTMKWDARDGTRVFEDPRLGKKEPTYWNPHPVDCLTEGPIAPQRASLLSPPQIPQSLSHSRMKEQAAQIAKSA